MSRWCNLCQRSFPTARGFKTHNSRIHRHPKPKPAQASRKTYHHHLTARPCDQHGNFLPPDALPPQQPPRETWDPFEDRASWEFTAYLVEKMHASKEDINTILRILSAKRTLQTNGQETSNGFFQNAEEMGETVDEIPFGDLPWFVYRFRVCTPEGAEEDDRQDAPWKYETYEVYARDPVTVLECMAANPEYDGKWDYVPYAEYPSAGIRTFSDVFSGRFVWRQADEIAKLPDTRGSMLVVPLLGADKTTVSVATGHQEYHPLYVSVGNITNEMRRAHGQGVIPLAFLPIPKTARDYADTDEFRLFKKQLYHSAIACVLEPLRKWMTEWRVIKCPDGHYRRSICELGPFIADYPEQVYVSGVVQGWCPKCRAPPDELEHVGLPRFRAHTECLVETFDSLTLWDVFGVVADVVPFTYRLPRADIHELLTPDILHQVIKGTFKDHLVSWVEDYIKLSAPSDAEAKRILDDIDRRIAAAPSFPGLRRFPEGRNFSQWTGNDSKALMKVYLPAIMGHVPDDVVRCIAAFLDFCYLARRPSHSTRTLQDMQTALARFHALRPIFEEIGVRPEGFSLPRQHALVHYVRAIQLFGSPNGLCSSITESKHITAVKIPWRSSNRYDALAQMLETNTRLSKLAAARVEYGRSGMLEDDVFTHALRAVDLPTGPTQAISEARFRDELDATDVADETGDSSLAFAAKPVYTRRFEVLEPALRLPQLHESIRRYLYEQLYPELEPGDAVLLDACPDFPMETRIGIYNAASATFYAPSEISGPGGMHREIIRSTPSWYGQFARYDTILVRLDDDQPGMAGMLPARVLLFFSFTYEDTTHSCAYVEWFETEGVAPDPVTGMWRVRPECVNGQRVVGVIDIDTIERACHLLPVHGKSRMPAGFHFSDTLDAFRSYFVNRYIDYHAHETIY